MSLDQLSTGTKVFLGSGVLLFVVSLFKWNSVDVQGFGGGSFANGWEGAWGMLFGVCLLASLVWAVLGILNVQLPELPVDRALIGTGLAALAVVFGVLRWIMKPEGSGLAEAAGIDVGWSFWGWLALLLLIAFAVGTFLRWQEGSQAAPASS